MLYNLCIWQKIILSSNLKRIWEDFRKNKLFVLKFTLNLIFFRKVDLLYKNYTIVVIKDCVYMYY